MKLAKFFAVIILSGIFCHSQAQELSGIPGSFVDIGFGAKPVGFGGAYVGYANDVNSVIWNPAGLTSISMKEVSFTYTKQLDLIDYHYLAAAMPLDKKSGQAAGIAIIHSGDDAMREFTVQASYSQLLYGIRVGGSVKMRYASFGNNTINPDDYAVFEPDEIQEGIVNQVRGSGIGFGFDLGAIYNLSESVNLGLMLKDIYSPVFWNSENDSETNKPEGSYNETIPFEVTIGSSIRLIDEVYVNADFSPSIYEEPADIFRIGTQATLFKIVSLRAGTQQFINTNDGDEKYVLGLGIYFNRLKDFNISIDYTYLIEDLANSQRFSLSLEF